MQDDLIFVTSLLTQIEMGEIDAAMKVKLRRKTLLTQNTTEFNSLMHLVLID